MIFDKERALEFDIGIETFSIYDIGWYIISLVTIKL